MAGEVRVIYASTMVLCTNTWLPAGSARTSTGCGPARPGRPRCTRATARRSFSTTPRSCCSPGDAWWTAAFNDVLARTEIYCDITKPLAQAEPDRGHHDRSRPRCMPYAPETVELLDEGEFACHQVRYSCPADVITQAARAAAWLRASGPVILKDFPRIRRKILQDHGAHQGQSGGSRPVRREDVNVVYSALDCGNRRRVLGTGCTDEDHRPVFMIQEDIGSPVTQYPPRSWSAPPGGCRGR